MSKNLTPKEKKALAEFKNRIFQKFGKEILELKLFGSKARRDFKKDSDIDILLVLKNASPKNKNTIYKITTQILLKYNVDLSVKIFSSKEFLYLTNLETPFMLNLKKEALPL